MTEENVEQPLVARKGTEAQPAWLEKAQSQWKLYAGLAAGVVLVAGGVYWYFTQKAEQNLEAAAQLAHIRSYFDQGEFQKALTADSVPPIDGQAVLGLEEISSQYEGTDAGAVAALMAGNALANLGKFAEAREHFERAGSGGGTVTEVGSLQGLAACKEAEGDYTGAAELYEKAAQRGSDSGFEGRCLFLAGLSFEKGGNKAKAAELYTTVVKKFESDAMAPNAKSGLARLGMAID